MGYGRERLHVIPMYRPLCCSLALLRNHINPFSKLAIPRLDKRSCHQDTPIP